MSVQTGTATDVADLLTQLHAFLLKGHSLDPIYAGSGTGTIEGLIGTAASILESITVTFSGATDFTVTGSTNGALGSGTVGTAFTSSVCAFTITAGGTAWASGDTITFTMTPPWVQKRAINPGTGTDEYIWMAPGNDGDSEIYVGVQRFANASGDYDNLRLMGAIGYDAAQPFASQPQCCSRPVLPLLRVGSMPYWLIASGRRVIIVAKASTVYESAYLGLMQQYQNPGQYQYPLVVAGSMSWETEPEATSTNWRWSYQGEQHRAFPLSGFDVNNVHNRHQLRYRNPSGVWLGATMKSYSQSSSPIGYIWPYWGMGDMRANLDGSYPLFPVVLHEDFQHTYVSGQVDGELEGVFAATGYGISSEDIVTSGRLAHLVVQNINRTTKENYFAVRLA